MTAPSFRALVGGSASEYRKLLSDLVRLERKQRSLTQHQFAQLLGVPVRTYKRFELGTCDSLDIFLRIVILIERSTALDLVFPKPAAVLKPRTPSAVMAQLEQRKAEKEQSADKAHNGSTSPKRIRP